MLKVGLGLCLGLGPSLGLGCRDQSGVPAPAAPASSPGPAFEIASGSAVTVTVAEASAPAARPFVPERVTGTGHAMGTHLSFAAFTTPALDAGKLHAAFDAATDEIVLAPSKTRLDRFGAGAHAGAFLALETPRGASYVEPNLMSRRCCDRKVRGIL